MNSLLKIIVKPIWYICKYTIIIPLTVKLLTKLSWDDVLDEVEDFFDN